MNWDWLYVRVPRERIGNGTDDGGDLARQFSSVDEVYERLNQGADVDVLRFLFDRVQDYGAFVEAVGRGVRDKAKSLFSTASFVAAIVLGAISIFTVVLRGWPLWSQLVALGIFTPMAMHFVRGLWLALEVTTREATVRQSPAELVELGSREMQDVYRRATAQVLAYANQTLAEVWTRLNKLIAGQTAFRYGLAWFALFVFVVLGVSAWRGQAGPNIEVRVQTLEDRIASIELVQAEESARLREEIGWLRDDVSNVVVELFGLLNQ